jgi:hypothetical protein
MVTPAATRWNTRVVTPCPWLLSLPPAVLGLALAGLVLLAAPSASAMPMFARKYNMACTDCHDALVYPRLNAAGFKFRRAGFRMPEQIGKEEAADYRVTDYFSGRIRFSYAVEHERQSGESDTSASFELDGVTLYPVTGSFEKHWATEAEISFSGEGVELENTYLRGAWGEMRAWIEARAGLFHTLEGFGASDRPIGVSAPLLLTESAVQNQDTLFRIREPDRLGAELGVQWRDLSVSVFALNPLSTEVSDGELEAIGFEPPAGNGRVDFVAFANQLLGERSGVSAYYTHGSIRLPVDPDAFVAGTDEQTWRNNYDRIAVFGSAGLSRVMVLGGAGLGFDQARDPATGNRSRFTSRGAFLEGDLAFGAHVVSYVRVDWFDPSASADTNDRFGATGGAVLYTDWISLLPELQYRYQRDPAGNLTVLNAVVQARAIY